MPVGPAVAPGAGGIAVRWGVIAYVGLLVAMPLAALLASGLGEGVSALWQAVSSPLAADALGSAKTGTLGGLKIVGRRARRTREGEWGTPYVLLDRKAEANYQQYLETSKESA